ncbi:MAG TPA: hypothetical protein VIG08_09550 [Gemmatimonadales bacterium]|jgi:hypothetical protein
MSRIAVAAAATLLACSPGDGGARGSPADSSAASAPAAASDSLATAGPGVEIWFTLSRTVSTPVGKSCVDRAIELRRGEKRTPIPLLYTQEKPQIVSDTTARAILYSNCIASDTYLVDLRSGRPTREKR